MSDDRDRITETRTTEPADAPPAQPTHTTVIERRGGGGGLLIGLAVLIVVIVGAYFLFNQSRNDTLQTEAVTTAADPVGDAAKQVGDSAETAADSVTKQKGLFQAGIEPAAPHPQNGRAVGRESV